MPELPEVETVRRGLAEQVIGSTVTEAQVLGARTLRRHEGDASDFAGRLVGRRLVAARRRGKFLWVSLDDGAALLAHLGMSGQMRVNDIGDPVQTHTKARFTLDGGPRELRFVDQRTFGGLAIADDGDPVPPALSHVAPDPLEPAFDDATFSRKLRSRHQGIKRALLDQRLISGVGNIYADEALWRARFHWAKPTDGFRSADVAKLVCAVRSVLEDAIRAGGTSFDALYVAVNGQSGWFDRSLAAYGQSGEPCPRCGRAIIRERFANRSSYRCPRCQPTPRNPRW